MKKSLFNLTHERKFSCKFGQLVPIMCEDVLPGDTFSNVVELFVRLAPQLAPVMHRVSVSTHFFFVPNRIIWRTSDPADGQTEHDAPHNGWERFITGYENDGRTPTEEAGDELECEPTLGINYPTTTTDKDGKETTAIPSDRKPTAGSLFDYLYGIPTTTLSGDPQNNKIKVSALPARAYSLIWNEYYRDEDLQDPVSVSFRSNDTETDKKGHLLGFDTFTAANIFHRCYEKDYFTSARPWPQKGPPVTVPVSGSAPVRYVNNGRAQVVGLDKGNMVGPASFSLGAVIDTDDIYSTKGLEKVAHSQLIKGDGGLTDTGVSIKTDASGNPYLAANKGGTDTNVFNIQGAHSTNTDYNHMHIDPNGTLYADLQKTTGITINKLRLSFQLQKFLERNARAGARYVESILAHFQERSPDFRLDRPEFLGGSKSHIVFSEVLQTGLDNSAGNAQKSPLGSMAGHAFSAERKYTFKRHFSEHGWIIGILSVMPRTSYQQGVPRRFNRKNRWDYYFPEFAHLGEQAILSKELAVVDEDSESDVVNPDTDKKFKWNEVPFGYQAVWDEYRRRESSVHGDFRTSLSYWHMGRVFTSANDRPPQLTDTFVHFQSKETSDRVFPDASTDMVWIQLINHLHAVRPMPRFGIPGLIDHL
jgi:hypothetical protein